MKGKTGKMAPKKMQVGGSTMDQRDAARAQKRAAFDARIASNRAGRNA